MDSVDVVYVLGTGSLWDNNELRFSLRSLQNLKNFKTVWIVGECPRWITNINHIQCKDYTRIPDTNIMMKLTTACENAGITDDFLFVNDDHYLVTRFDAPTFPYYYFKTMHAYTQGSTYAMRVRNTLNYLLKKDLPVKYFDIHTPIIFNKSKFIENVTKNWNKAGFVVKSLYANSLLIEGVEEPDYKIHKPEEAHGAGVISTKPNVHYLVKQMLFNLFPKKSIFEK